MVLAEITVHIIPIIVAAVIAGVLYWLVGEVEAPPKVGKILRVLIVVVFILWLAQDLGLIGRVVSVG